MGGSYIRRDSLNLIAHNAVKRVVDELETEPSVARIQLELNKPLHLSRTHFLWKKPHRSRMKSIKKHRAPVKTKAKARQYGCSSSLVMKEYNKEYKAKCRSNDATKTAAAGAPASYTYTIQFASFRLRHSAEILQKRLTKKGIETRVAEIPVGQDEIWYAVRIDFNSKQEAFDAAEKYKGLVRKSFLLMKQ